MSREVVVFVVSHNNANEGAPRLCEKLALGLHRGGWFERVYLCALAEGACPLATMPVVRPPRLEAMVRSQLAAGKRVRVVLSTVIGTRAASGLRARAGPSGDLSIAGLVHEVRNETFSWVVPEHLAGCDRLAFVAEHTASTYGPEYAPGAPREVVHNWLSEGERASIDRAPCDRSAPVVLAVGVVGEHKGQLCLARAVRALRETRPEFRLVVLGHVYDGAYAARVKAVDPEGIEIAGPASHERALEMMRACRVFAHGSPMESCCLSVMEAMYAGCPVVAARVGGVPEQITHGADGLLYAPGDHLGCAAALAELAGSPELCASLGAEARRTVEGRFAERDKLERYARMLTAGRPTS